MVKPMVTEEEANEERFESIGLEDEPISSCPAFKGPLAKKKKEEGPQKGAIQISTRLEVLI